MPRQAVGSHPGRVEQDRPGQALLHRRAQAGHRGAGEEGGRQEAEEGGARRRAAAHRGGDQGGGRVVSGGGECGLLQQ